MSVTPALTGVVLEADEGGSVGPQRWRGNIGGERSQAGGRRSMSPTGEKKPLLSPVPPLPHTLDTSTGKWLNPVRAPEPLPILNPSNFVPKNGFQL